MFVCFILVFSEICIKQVFAQTELKVRQRQNFCKDWKFYLGDVKGASYPFLTILHGVN